MKDGAATGIAVRRTQWIGAGAGAATGLALVPLLLRWGQHRWLLGTGHAIAAMVVLTWTAAGFLTGLAARRLAADRGEATALALGGIGAGTLAVSLLMAAFPLQYYRGGDSSIPVAEGAEAIIVASAVVSLLTLATSVVLARSSGRSTQRSRALTRVTAVLIVGLGVSLPLAVQAARNETGARRTFEAAGGSVWSTDSMVDEALRPLLLYVQLPSDGSPTGPESYAADTALAQEHVAFEAGYSARVVGLTAPRDLLPAPDLAWVDSPPQLGGVYSLPDATRGSLVLDSAALAHGQVFAVLCQAGDEAELAESLGYSPVPWGPGFCDGTAHVFTVHAVGGAGTVGGQVQVSVLGRFPTPLFCPEPGTSPSLVSAAWLSTPASSPCLDVLTDSWRQLVAKQSELTSAGRWATGIRSVAAVLTFLVAIAVAPVLTALRGRIRTPGRGPGPRRRVGRPAAVDLSQGLAAGLVASAADALDDPGLAERFLEEWQADLAQFRQGWRRLLFALGVRVLAPRRLRAARRVSAPDPPAHS